jgi:hypothetical protein
MTEKPNPAEFNLEAFIEVSRKAHELHGSHGWNAHQYAAKLAAVALAKGATEEYEFWKRVEGSLTPR